MGIEYQKGNSILHQLDPRTKLLLFVGVTITSIIIVDPVIMGLLFFTLYLIGKQGVDNEVLNKNLRGLVIIFLTFSLFQVLFFTPKDSHHLFYLIPFTKQVSVTVEGLVRGVAVFFRFFSVVLSVHLMLYTTPPVELALTVTEREKNKLSQADIFSTIAIALVILVSFLPVMLNLRPPISFLRDTAPIYRNLIMAVVALVISFLIQKALSRGLPPEMGIALMLGFSTVGILTKQTQKITDAQKARGYDVKPKNIFKRVQNLTAMLIPIFLTTMERSQDISVSILSRGFDYNIKKRTFRRQFQFQKNDYLVMAVFLIVIIGGMLLNQYGIGNFTEKFIFSLLN
ncbi:MAG: energy-coupling factor transporter transmembrane protein EcfT [Chloroflexi bacterium]|jgi:energy-coupling factor transport system permease protein|nr:energy-coupling factor transporter transmembrane protein EcfT [Chloroflexota bacterium]